MKKPLILAVILTAIIPAYSATDAENAVSTTKAFVEALRVHDYPTMVALLPPPLVKAQGGKEKIVAALEAAKETDEVAIESATFPGDDEKINATDAIIFLVKADIRALHRKQTRIVLHTFYVSFRFKDQTTWSVLDGTKYGEGQLRKLFRGLPEPLNLPKVTAEVVKEEANQPAQTTATAGMPAGAPPARQP